MQTSLKQLLALAVAAIGLTTSSAAPAAGGSVVPDRMEPTTPKFREETKNVGITEHLGDTIPLNLTFTDTNGRPAVLGDYFKKGRPVILQLGYFNCPQLCDVVSKKFMEGIKAVPLEINKDYSVLYVSVDPEEQWELGRDKKRTYVEEFGNRNAVDGWNFLVGHDSSIRPLARAVGFGYKKLEGKEEFSHPPMLVVLTGEGKISRYFYGFQFPSDTLKASIEEASQGKIGPYVQQILVALCYHFDEYSGKYSLAYMRLMQAGGAFTVLVVGTWLGSRWVREARANRRAATTS